MPIPRATEIPTLSGTLLPGPELDYPIICYKQVFQQISFFTEFSSYRFNLRSSLIAPNVNVRFDKVINLVAGDSNLKVCPENADIIQAYDAVNCVVFSAEWYTMILSHSSSSINMIT